MEGLLAGLFAQYSLESIIIFVVVLGLALKGIYELWDYFKRILKERFRQEDYVEETTNSLQEQLVSLDNKLDNINLRFDKMDSDFQETKDKLSILEERQQESTRSFLIDSHHKFCYEIQAIDDINLQSIERRYMYYKTAGGNGFVDGLMQDIRQLPRVNISTYKRANVPDEGENKEQ